MTGAFSVEDISIAVHRRSGLDTALGEELVREQIGTIEQSENRVIDPEQIGADDTERLVRLVEKVQPEVAARSLDDLYDAQVRCRDAVEHLEEARAHRDAAVCAALATGVSWDEVTTTTGLSRGQIADIRKVQPR
ncbi:Hypothetical protein CGLY_11995 [Corynebacterium glyciniphilum AJ 3170]|jgi:phage FluMu protein gp41|uniref:Uncharacterized protein n=1 Tax=Corynebacterium glyciniphilum AJ 3170 TaxID=1404245 RepID=X5DU94_9CORY|nr:hypothetical protein [Corynebacterium glyciniphilum]AHW64839.1 Hypothetical protein CGLY_11995 [Corynebacterium glyciniphilum AJ 3170]